MKGKPPFSETKLTKISTLASVPNIHAICQNFQSLIMQNLKFQETAKTLNSLCSSAGWPGSWLFAYGKCWFFERAWFGAILKINSSSKDHIPLYCAQWTSGLIRLLLIFHRFIPVLSPFIVYFTVFADDIPVLIRMQNHL